MNRTMVRAAITGGRWVERLVRPKTRASPESARSIMVFEFMLPLGVLVHMTPLFEALKRGHPERIVTVATRAIGLEVLRHSPYVDHLIEVPDPMQSHHASARVLQQRLSELGVQPDCCLTATSDRRTRVALLAARVCRGWRGGFTAHASLYHHALRTDEELSQIGNNLRLAKLIGSPSVPSEPKMFYSEEDVAQARGLLAPMRERSERILVAVTQGSGGQRTGWHDDRWVRVLAYAHEIHGYAVVLVGTGADALPIAALRNQTSGVASSLAGKTRIGELAALLAMSDLVVSLDTGSLHVGRAVGVPMIVLGPSWQKPVEWLPVGLPQVKILRGEDRAEVPEGYRLDEISAEAVMNALDEMTERFPARESAREARVLASVSHIDHLRA